MRTGIRLLSIAVVVVAVVAVSRAAPQRDGQAPSQRYFTPHVYQWGQSAAGSEIGISVRDVEQADIAREKLSGAAGAVIEEVRSESAAAKAGLKAGDVVVDFDGERVRSARQLSRLVDETPAGRDVKMSVMRGGQRVDANVAPTQANGLAVFENGRGLERLERFAPNLQFDMPEFREFTMPHFDFEMRSRTSRLGVSVSELTSQLSEHLGAKQGVLVTEVTADSPARTAGLKAGDVIATIDGKAVTSSSDIRRAITDAASDDVTIGIVRDKKEMELKAKIERPERVRRSARRAV